MFSSIDTLNIIKKNFAVLFIKMSEQEKGELQREFLEIHTKLGDSSLKYEIRCQMEKRKEEIIKEYFIKFGKHISGEL